MVWGACLSLLLLRHALGVARATPTPAGGGGYWPGLPDTTPFYLMTAAVLLHAPWSIGCAPLPLRRGAAAFTCVCSCQQGAGRCTALTCTPPPSTRRPARFHAFRGISADTYNLWRRLDQVRRMGVGGQQLQQLPRLVQPAAAPPAVHRWRMPKHPPPHAQIESAPWRQ